MTSRSRSCSWTAAVAAQQDVQTECASPRVGAGDGVPPTPMGPTDCVRRGCQGAGDQYREDRHEHEAARAITLVGKRRLRGRIRAILEAPVATSLLNARVTYPEIPDPPLPPEVRHG